MAPSIDMDKLKELRWTSSVNYDAGSIITYHIAIGVEGTQLDRSWEEHPDFHAMPTFASLAVINIMGKVTRDMPKFLAGFQPARHPHVHGEHYLELKRPFPTSGTLVSEARVDDLVDRRGGVAVSFGITTKCSSTGAEICYNKWTSFLINMPATGVGSWSRNKTEVVAAAQPKRNPDAAVSHKTTPEQGALYRAASGEWNPMHIDPATAKKAGFPGPILSGTCTIGLGVKHVIDTYADKDSTLFHSVRLRLSKPVFPGEVVRTEMWREDDGRRIVYQQSTPDGKVVISQAVVELKKQGQQRESGRL